MKAEFSVNKIIYCGTQADSIEINIFNEKLCFFISALDSESDPLMTDNDGAYYINFRLCLRNKADINEVDEDARPYLEDIGQIEIFFVPWVSHSKSIPEKGEVKEIVTEIKEITRSMFKKLPKKFTPIINEFTSELLRRLRRNETTLLLEQAMMISSPEEITQIMNTLTVKEIINN